MMFMDKGLPKKVAVYFHELPESTHLQFCELVLFFREHGYEFVGPSEICNNSSESSVFFSFDDNFSSWYQSLGLFDEMGIKVVFYVNSLPFSDIATNTEIQEYFSRILPLEDRTPLSTKQLIALDKNGHVIGGHGHSHRMLSSLTMPEAHNEIRMCKENLQEILGHEIEHFSYPFGMKRHFSNGLREYCKEIGFSSIANATPGLQHCGHTVLSINRSVWSFNKTFQINMKNLCLDGNWFSKLTGRSCVG